MITHSLFYALTCVCLLRRYTYAADCDQPRKYGDPSGTDIMTALTEDNQLAEVCSGNFPPTNDTANTFNHWYAVSPSFR